MKTNISSRKFQSLIVSTRLENDNKNLQIVINQLRQAGRAKSGETESIQQEVITLRQNNINLTKDFEEAKKLLKDYEKYPELLAERMSLLQQVSALEATLSDMKRNTAILEKDLYAKTTGYEILLSEQRMSKQELQQRQEELNNLQDAMEQILSEHRFEINHYKSMLHEAQQRNDEARSQKFQEEQAKLQLQIDDLTQQLVEQRNQCEDLSLLRRQAEIQFHQEKKKMQSVLENALKQLQNSSHDVVDRMLIANLIVSYFKRRR